MKHSRGAREVINIRRERTHTAAVTEGSFVKHGGGLKLTSRSKHFHLSDAIIEAGFALQTSAVQQLSKTPQMEQKVAAF